MRKNGKETDSGIPMFRFSKFQKRITDFDEWIEWFDEKDIFCEVRKDGNAWFPFSLWREGVEYLGQDHSAPEPMTVEFL